ncbi:hypothetical protein K435DRAFT_528486 [Dendrothele bispora CBS 962.96]|uniref:Uncharacterized protein n=1 Tax=Dendrothele bispora (strain CBS 962.96) TaxID=1314807 RepID=A0A4S8KU41_DENBC|nr:hypothetical protein K435DRAFT_528486 [Dendrothele bispora CBS 962.96]
MKLYQKESSYNSILNNTYVDDTGRAIYKVHTLHPNSLAGPGTTTISKVYYSTARDSVPVVSPSKLPVSPSEDVTPENAEGLNKPSVMDEEYELAVAAESEEDPDFTSSSGPSSALQFRGKRNSGGSQSRVSIKGNGSLDDDADPSEHQSSSTTPNQGVEDRPHDASGFPLEHIAQIDWKVFKSSRLRFGDGKEVLAKDFFRKETWGWYGR